MCDYCHGNTFQYYCKKCNEYVCTMYVPSATKTVTKRGDKEIHDQIEVYSRQNNTRSVFCKVHPDQVLQYQWFTVSIGIRVLVKKICPISPMSSVYNP